MQLHTLNTETIVKEIIDRIGDQLHDPEPMYDSVFTRFSAEELEDLLSQFQSLLTIKQ